MTRSIRKVAAVMAVCFFACGIAAFFLYPKQQEEIAGAEREIQLLRRQKEVLDAFSARHMNAAEEKKRLDNKEKLIRKLLPRKQDTAGFLSELQVWSQRSGVRLVKLLPREEKSYETYREQGISVTVRGAYFEWLDFLYLLEQSGRFVRVEELKGSADEAGIFEGTMEVYIFSSLS